MPTIRNTGLAVLLIVTIVMIVYGENSGRKSISIKIKLDADIIDQSDYGEPPQIAVWLEYPDGRMVTVGVSRRSAENRWKGKIHCNTCLPIWRHRFVTIEQKQKSVLPLSVDAYTKASAKGNLFFAKAFLEAGKDIDCFLEINLSGDYNRSFPFRDANGMPDPQGNGQPSLVYYTRISLDKVHQESPSLIGRSDQLNPVSDIIKDVGGITTARQLIKSISLKLR